MIIKKNISVNTMLYVWLEGEIIGTCFDMVEAFQMIKHHIFLAKMLEKKDYCLGDFIVEDSKGRKRIG